MAKPAVQASLISARASAADVTRRCPTCGASYPSDFVVCPKDTTRLELSGSGGTDPLLGEVLAGTYRITEVIGSGGMGRVYLAEHVRLSQRFAVKVMHDKLADLPEAMGRFEREAKVASSITNEHVLRVLDVVRAKDQRPCIVTELLEGQGLDHVLDRKGKLPLAMAISFCRQACRGVAAAHEAGVVHRDLKPSNLFLVERDEGGELLKILDFGVAKVMDGEQLTRTGMVVGTPAYMAPEQARGSSNVDTRADIYALGAILYRMVTGVAPFPEDEDPAMTMGRLVSEDPRRPRSIDSSIPAGVEAIIQRAMARSPADRPASAAELDGLLAPFEHAARAAADEIGTMATVTAPAPLLDGAADEMTLRARRARPAALALSVAVSLITGAAVLVAAASGLRLTHQALVEEHRFGVTAAIAAASAILLFLSALRVLYRRWRSVPSVARLGDTLRSAPLWLFGGAGVLVMAYRGAVAFGPPLPEGWEPYIDAAILIVPVLLCFVVIAVGLRRASRVS